MIPCQLTCSWVAISWTHHEAVRRHRSWRPADVQWSPANLVTQQLGSSSHGQKYVKVWYPQRKCSISNKTIGIFRRKNSFSNILPKQTGSPENYKKWNSPDLFALKALNFLDQSGAVFESGWQFCSTFSCFPSGSGWAVDSHWWDTKMPQPHSCCPLCGQT